MAISNNIVEAAVRRRVAQVQKDYDAQETAVAERNRMLKDVFSWTSVPDNITDEKLGALLAFMAADKMAAFRLRPEFLDDLEGRFMPQMVARDRGRLQKILTKIGEESLLKIKPETLRIETFQQPPEEPGGEWTLVAVPVFISQNGKAGVPDIMKVDLSISMQVSPHENAGLTEFFNSPSMYIPAGHPGRPLAMTYKPVLPDAPARVIVSGYVSGDDGFGQKVTQPVILHKTFNVPGESRAQPEAEKKDGLSMNGFIPPPDFK